MLFPLDMTNCHFEPPTKNNLALALKQYFVKDWGEKNRCKLKTSNRYYHFDPQTKNNFTLSLKLCFIKDLGRKNK